VRLGQRIILTTGSLVVLIGLVTMGLLQMVFATGLGKQLDENGLAIARVLANDLADPLLDGDGLVVQRNLHRLRQEGESVVYAYALAPDQRKVIHTFAEGFPPSLLEATRLMPGQSARVQYLLTEQGPVRDYAVRLLEGLDAEVHVGLTEAGILASNRRVMWLMVGLTSAGVLIAVLLAWILGRYVARPLEYLTATVEEIGEGRLDRQIPVTSRDEVGDLADGFNRMLIRLQEAMERERTRNRELTALYAVARVVSLNDTLTEMLSRALGEVVQVLGLQGAWILLMPEDESGQGEVAAVAGLNLATACQCSCKNGSPCSCWQALKSAGRPADGSVGVQCAVAPLLEPGSRILGPFPLVSSGRTLGFMNAVVPAGAPIQPQDSDMLYAIGRQLGVALERAHLWIRLSEREERVRQLLQKVIDAQEEERRRIARELHDETSQSMAAITVGLKAAASLTHRDPGRAETLLEGLKEAMAHTLREIHNIVYDLRPTLLDDRGLVPALHWCASQRLGEQGVAVDVTAGGRSERLPPQVETTLFRIGQEAINNVAKHAGAQSLHIHLQVSELKVRLSVVDDGKGFDAIPSNGEKRSLGLIGMSERAGLLGGTCQVSSVPGEGTRIDVMIPLEGGMPVDPHSAGR